MGCPAFIQHLLFLSGENLDVGLELGGDFGEAVDFGGALGEVGALSGDLLELAAQLSDDTVLLLQSPRILLLFLSEGI